MRSEQSTDCLCRGAVAGGADQLSFAVNLLSWRILLAEKLDRLKELQARYILLSATDPGSTAAVGKMAESLRALLPDATILVGLWNLPPSGAARLFRKIKESAASDIYTNLDQAVRGAFLPLEGF